jgi:outer membrane lipoprotein-sorting protein
VDKDKVINTFIDSVESAKSYKMNGKMEIYNAEDTYSYNIQVLYMDDNYYKVNMLNLTNKHEQIILRYDEAVYVVTPSLNKSYKFTSEWPYNSSQSYILNTLVKDINNDEEIEYENINNEHILKVNVNYPNNKDLIYQKLYFDSKLNLLKVDVYDKDDILSISVTFDEIDYKANLEDKDFDIDLIMESECCNTKESSNEIDGDEEVMDDVTEDVMNEESILNDIVYPLYVPTDTYLKTKELVSTENGERAILMFNGAKNFILIEEVSNISEEFETIPVFGDPLMISDTIGVVSSNSLSWSYNNMDYYLASNDMSTDEILTVANSLNATQYVDK